MTRTRFTILTVLLLAGCAERAATAPQSPQAAAPTGVRAERLEPTHLGAMKRVHRCGDVYLAGQPSAADLVAAKDLGVKTVVTFRYVGETPDFHESKAVAASGMTYVGMPWKGTSELTDEFLDHARGLLATVERPVLVHCAAGARVGTVWLAWRALDDGLPLEEAAAEAHAVGLNDGELEAKARDYVARRAKPQR